MEITIKDLENDLKTLPKELLQQVSDYVAFLKFKYSKDFELEEWQKEVLDERLRYLEENPNETLNFDNTIAELKKKYS
ncbi:hypothetical protein [Epilithonimonas sp.]|uniref:hypothetical protein n=1 Tax=Epilithonimonas sp. TaxID=2894511 RepID=UPI00289C22B1|nr:hypothetical protein [Epilithonimonas sp.]